MSKKIFYNNPVFRLSAPLLSGIVIYLLILMFFDSVDMLARNFFSREVLFIIGLTYVFFELNRLVILLTDAIAPQERIFQTRILIQYALAVAVTALATSFVLYLYFTLVEGFSTITTELLTFNGIYIFAALFYHLYYFSIHFLYKQNDELLHAEKVNRDNLRHELSKFRNQINPSFLFQALEIIVTELHASKKHSDELVGHLAQIYRYTLDNQHNDLAELPRELESLSPAVEIFRTRYPDSLFIHDNIVERNGIYLVPGTLLTLFEHAVINNLITSKLPLHFHLASADGILSISHNLNQRITEADAGGQRITNLVNAYGHLSEKKFKSCPGKNEQNYEIPLLVVEEE